MTKLRFALIFICLFGLATILIYRNPILGKCLVGSARFIGKEIRSEVKINDKVEGKAKLYYAKSGFHNQKNNYYILYLQDIKEVTGESVIIINKITKKVYYPNAGINNYNTLIGFLFQSESGNIMVSLDDCAKGPCYQPNLKIGNKSFEFEIPNSNGMNPFNFKIDYD
jgi:hypothetical protein